MAYATYFEIGGHVIESYVEQPDGVGPRPRPMTFEKEIKRTIGVPAPLARAASREIKDKSGVDIGKMFSGISHAKRASWAARTALALSLIDGPLPFGDALAIGGLAVYGGYETYQAVKDFSEAV